MQYTYEYLPWRNVSKETFKFYDVKTKIAENGEPLSIGFKYPNGAIKIRTLSRKDFYTEGDIAHAGLFGHDRFAAGSQKTITITEGELDALSLYQVSKSPVVSVQSASSAHRDCVACRSYLNSYDRIILAFDNDAAGREARHGVAKLFDYDKVRVLDYSNRKDANEFLQHGEADALRSIWQNCKRYMPEQVISSYQEFEKILVEEPRKGIPYPFPTLNEMLYGIRTSESVLLTAQEGVGKTELMRAFEYQLLKETPTDVGIGAIFLEEPKRRHLQGLAGLEIGKAAHLPDSGIPTTEVISALKNAVGADERLNIYSHFGSSDPEILLDTVRFLASARACRYILLDHLSMAVSGLAGDDERRQLDYLSTRLEMMVKELDFALIMVSHVNDFGQTRGSRYISKIADIRIDAKRNLLHEDVRERNTVELVISKNRFSGKTGPAGKLAFDLNTYTFKEIEHASRHPDNQTELPGDSYRVNETREDVVVA